MAHLDADLAQHIERHGNAVGRHAEKQVRSAQTHLPAHTDTPDEPAA